MRAVFSKGIRGLAIGDLVHARNQFKAGLGVLVEKTSSRITIIDGNYQIMNFHSVDVDFQSPKWGRNPALSNSVDSKPFGRSLELLENAELKFQVIPTIGDLVKNSIALRDSIYTPISQAHSSYTIKKRNIVSLGDISRHVFHGSTEVTKLLALKSVLRGGIYFILQTPVDNPLDPIYAVRPQNEVEFILRVREDIRRRKRPTLYSSFVAKARKIIENFRKG